MSDRPIIRRGIDYVTAKDAAAAFGVTNDYIARLCRQEKLNGILEGRTWLVEAASLEAFFGRELLQGDSDSGIRIYYKNPEVRMAEVMPGQLAWNPAVLSVCPPEARMHRKARVSRMVRKVLPLARGSVLAVSLFFALLLGTGSAVNNDPSFASRSAQLATAGGTEFAVDFTNSARVFARTIDTIVYDIMYPNAEPTVRIVYIRHKAPVQATTSPMIYTTEPAATSTESQETGAVQK